MSSWNLLLNKYLIKLGIIEHFYSLESKEYFNTYLKSRRIELLRRKFNKLLVFYRLRKILQNDLNDYYKDLFSDSILISKFIKIKNLYGGFSLPDVLYVLIRKFKPNIVVETGVSYGISSAFILKALKDNGYGTLYSIDLPLPKYYIEKRKNRRFCS